MTFNDCINVGGRLFDLSEPRVMGIINLTPDSFYAPSRVDSHDTLAERVRKMISEGAAIIDVGACSTRPDSIPASEEEEIARLRYGLPVIVREAEGRAVISVDTFRSDIAKMCVEEYGAEIINDVTGGKADKRMMHTVANLHVPYVLTHSEDVTREESLLPTMMLQLSRCLLKLRDMGVADVILDPGFGFGKTLEQNYEIMNGLENFAELELPLLVGVSRKSMIWRMLNTIPENTLNATTALHAIALIKGAKILRVHDVKEAVEAVRIFNAVCMKSSKSEI